MRFSDSDSIRNKNYSKDKYDFVLTGEALEISGKVEEFNYDDIDLFLQKVDQSLTADTCKIVIDKLHFINSSGIKSIFTFINNSTKKFEIHMNERIIWQKRNIPIIIAPLMDKVIIIRDRYRSCILGALGFPSKLEIYMIPLKKEFIRPNWANNTFCA